MDNRKEIPGWLLWGGAFAIAAAIVGISAWIANGPPAATIEPTVANDPPKRWIWLQENGAGASDVGGAGERHAPNDIYGPCEILRVIDGDTMDVQIPLWRDTVTTRRVRVWGCDTPERKTATLSAWKAATEYTRGWSTRHNNIRVLHKGVDSLGRQLCMVMGDDEAGNEHMLHVDLIAAGHAVKRESK